MAMFMESQGKLELALPQSWSLLLRRAGIVIKENDLGTLFSGEIPGKDWWQRFFRPWPTLAERKAQHLSKNQAKSANPETVGKWFEQVHKLFSEIGLQVLS